MTTTINLAAPVQPWQPNLDAAVAALSACVTNPEQFADTFRKELTDDARAVLDASGANAEIERLRAVLHAAQFTITTLRDENQLQANLLLAFALEPVLSAPPGPDELAAEHGIDLERNEA
jgi:hypothetical protein